jgi:hypothetical protein
MRGPVCRTPEENRRLADEGREQEAREKQESIKRTARKIADKLFHYADPAEMRIYPENGMGHFVWGRSAAEEAIIRILTDDLAEE